jgi:hypothetical protein
MIFIKKRCLWTVGSVRQVNGFTTGCQTFREWRRRSSEVAETTLRNYYAAGFDEPVVLLFFQVSVSHDFTFYINLWPIDWLVFVIWFSWFPNIWNYGRCLQLPHRRSLTDILCPFVAAIVNTTVFCETLNRLYDVTSRKTLIFCVQLGPLSLVSVTEELLECKSGGSGSRKPRLMAVGIRCADYATPSIHKFGTNFADKRRSLGFI